MVPALLLATQASAQGSQEDLAARRDKKLKSAFLQKADWITDYDKARARAKQSGKLIFAYFTRSYAP
ncbi:MAG: hypothetical protein ACE5F1_14750 [Planctomycetota bacterium]